MAPPLDIVNTQGTATTMSVIKPTLSQLVFTLRLLQNTHLNNATWIGTGNSDLFPVENYRIWCIEWPLSVIQTPEGNYGLKLTDSSLQKGCVIDFFVVILAWADSHPQQPAQAIAIHCLQFPRLQYIWRIYPLCELSFWERNFLNSPFVVL